MSGRSAGHRAALSVAVDARLFSGHYGGVEQVIAGLAHGLSELDEGPERYHFLVFEGEAEWLSPYISGSCSLFQVPPPEEPVTWRHRLVRALPRVAAARRALLGPRPQPAIALEIPAEPEAIRAASFDIIHFTKQDGFLTSRPSIFHPHDLQHLHFPEFFTPREIGYRELTYRAFCEQADMVTVTSEWGKRDLVDHWSLASDKVVVIPLAPAVAAYPDASESDLRAAREALALPAHYIAYPAQTWPHKNHARLMEALAILRDERGLRIPLVCTGKTNEHYATLQAKVAELGLEGQVRFVGFVEPTALQAVYRGARATVFPSLFEAAGGFGPVFESFLAGVPVACSTATSLPEQVGDAALLFDPLDSRAIASAVARLWEDASLRSALAERGRRRVASFTWDRTARTFRAHYRRICGRPLTDEDIALMNARTDF